MEEKQSVILYPSVGMGHLTPMLELAKLFIGHGFSVTVVVIDYPSFDTSMDSFISRVASAHPTISFHRLPKVAPPVSKHPMVILSETIRLANDHLLDFLRSKKSASDVRAVVLDMFCSASLDVLEELHLPSYFFISTSASVLAAFLFLPTMQSQITGSFGDLGSSPLHFPGLPPIPASDLPAHVQAPGEANDALLAHFDRMPRADGIMINTFESLERRAVRALVGGACVPGRAMPPVYCIGPLVADGGDGKEEGGERHGCLAWLDAQPERSVVFLCFGSMGSFSTEQLRETAVGLERSGQRFLWAVRSPPSDPAKPHEPRPEPKLEALLPEGFLERTRERGMVLKSWAPQAAVLAHESVGGFVSHCGWNSSLEAVCSGVPMVAWPLYAEQRMNRASLVEEAKVAVAMEGNHHAGLVSADEVEAKIRWLMGSDEGRALREQMTATKEKAAAARTEGGESTLALLELVRAVRKATPVTAGA